MTKRGIVYSERKNVSMKVGASDIKLAQKRQIQIKIKQKYFSVRKGKIETQRSGFDFERRSSGMSAL